ncbi:S9 family peptidase [Odoribacter laneus]|uniref:S9 family peptidase n=3 Tax=Odoribacter laneus TaxID=626933 RepID=UPI00258FAFA7|nr:S9 family peptidase [Odoribacter laneus]
MKNIIYPTLILLSLMACDNKKENPEARKGYKTPEQKLSSDIMTPEVLWSFGRISNPAISPDGSKAVYGVTYFNKEEDRSYTDLYVMNLADGKITQITDTDYNESDANWTPDGKRISYLAKGQLWEMNPDGSGAKQITQIEGGINGYLYAPDGSKIAYYKDIKMEPTVQDMHPDLPKAKARIINDQFYRHWNDWVEGYTHIFIADYTPAQPITSGKDIMKDEKWESPVRPWGGTEQLAWTRDGQKLIYTCRKKYGIDYAFSTNTDLYAYNTADGTTVNLTEGMMGYDKNPVLSPDGKKLAWESMERDGYEADKNRLFVMDLETGKKKDFTKNFDQSVGNLAWDKDNNTVWFISDYHATDEIYSLNTTSGEIKKHTDGIHNYTSVVPVNGSLITTQVSMSKPAEIYRTDPATGKDEELSFINKPLLDQLTMGKVEKRWVKTTDNKDMLVWMIYPPHFDPNQKYPAILYCEGGPQSTVSQFWSYRWNFQQMAANGYIIVAPNRRGLPGFGQEWLEQISGDYSGQNIKDYLSAIDEAKKEPYIDENRLGCIGASYGGYSVYYLAGHHNNRFKAFIAHCGIFDLEMQYYTTEEMWFAHWDLGGAPWEKNNKIAQRTYANSPHKFVGNWDTPILVIHGQKDFRIDASQGMAAFNAARMRGIPAQYLYFPEECHWVLGCQDGILWQRTFKAWLDKWLK